MAATARQVISESLILLKLCFSLKRRASLSFLFSHKASLYIKYKHPGGFVHQLS